MVQTINCDDIPYVIDYFGIKDLEATIKKLSAKPYRTIELKKYDITPNQFSKMLDTLEEQGMYQPSCYDIWEDLEFNNWMQFEEDDNGITALIFYDDTPLVILEFINKHF